MESVLIFDSGVGGLSVYQEIKAVLPDLHYIYAFDNAAFPYGELSDDVLVARVLGMVEAIANTHKVDLVVVACNTASTLVLPHLRTHLSVPVVGVVPAIKPAAALSSKKAIGLLATPATVSRSYTHELIRDFAPDCQVKLVGSTELVQMAEAKLRGEEISLSELERILAPLKGEVDCVVLGCTHFPLLKDEIGQVMGKGVYIVDSGAAIARRVSCLIKKGDDKIVSSVSDKQPNIAFGSARPEKEPELNLQLAKLDFGPVKPAPLFGDHWLHGL